MPDISNLPGKSFPIPKKYFLNNSRFEVFRRFLLLSRDFPFELRECKECDFLRPIPVRSFQSASGILKDRFDNPPSGCGQPVTRCKDCIELLYPLLPQRFDTQHLYASEFLTALENNSLRQSGFIQDPSCSYWKKPVVLHDWAKDPMFWMVGENFFQASNIWWGKSGLEILSEWGLVVPRSKNATIVLIPIFFFYDQFPDLVCAFFIDADAPTESIRHILGLTHAMKEATRLISLENGKIIYKGTDITRIGYRALMPLRAGMQVVFQNSDASLNPKMKFWDIFLEPSRLHRTYSDKRQEESAAVDLFARLELYQELFNRYPEQLSHGQKQRVAIARALITNPDLLFADEPVSALDPFIRSKILGLFRQKMEQGMAIVLISHDLEIVRLMSDTTMVMYKSRVVESGPSEEIYERPIHPYSELLMSAVLTIDPETERGRREKPTPATATEHGSSVCPYYPRCPIRKDTCRASQPRLSEISSGHWVACIEREKGREGR